MIHEIEITSLKVVDRPLPFEEENKERIDVFWQQAFAANQRLWNGRFFMFSDVVMENGVLHAKAHLTDFATFLFWRAHGRCASTTHITGTTFPVLADKSLLAIEMSRHTANAGRVYFPAGSFDMADIVDGNLDPVRNFTREMNEEIGIEIETDWLSGPLIIAQADNALHVTRKMNMPMNFEEIERHWQRHRDEGGDDEVAALVHIQSAGHIHSQMPTYAQELCNYHFNTQPTKNVS